MKVIRSKNHIVLGTACLGLLFGSTCFAQSTEPATKEELRAGFKAGIDEVKANYVACLAELGLTPDDVDDKEDASEDGEITDPEVLLCIDTKKSEHAALLEEYKALRSAFREQAKATREEAAAARQELVAEKKAAAKAKAAGKGGKE